MVRSGACCECACSHGAEEAEASVVGLACRRVEMREKGPPGAHCCLHGLKGCRRRLPRPHEGARGTALGVCAGPRAHAPVVLRRRRRKEEEEEEEKAAWDA